MNKIVLRALLVSAGLTMYISVLVLISLNLYSDVYENTNDPDKAEYYPAKIVSVYTTNDGSKYVDIKLEDSTVVSVYVSQSVYDKYNVDDTISFQKHISHPATRKAIEHRHDTLGAALIALVASIALSMFLMMIWGNEV